MKRLFDRTKPPDGYESEAIDRLNEIIGRLQQQKRSEIPIVDPTTGSKAQNRVRCYLQAHIRRCLTFVEAAVAEVHAGRPLAAALCMRALYENVATVCAFTDALMPLLEADNYAAVDALATEATFTTRIPALLEQFGEHIKAPQILKAVDAMESRFKGFRTAYDHLSDIVHPNGLGAFVYFGKQTDGIVRFTDSGKETEDAMSAVVSGALFLVHVDYSASLIEFQFALKSHGQPPLYQQLARFTDQD
jgi:hypothetical protein